MKTIFPEKLKIGDDVRVVAPSSSLQIVDAAIRQIADNRFKELGLRITFGSNTGERDGINSSPIRSRINDLHDAFKDPSVKAIICAIGGSNSNQLLPYIDWELIQKNPKIFLGYSDISVIQNAILAKTGLVTYSGPAYSTFGQKLRFDFTADYFRKCLMQTEPFELGVSQYWSDDEWYLGQDNRLLKPNRGIQIVQEGITQGTIVGGNLSSFCLLFGTEYMPPLENSIVFLEDDGIDIYRRFDRLFESLLQQPAAEKIAGIVFGRFEDRSMMGDVQISRLIALRPGLDSIPIIANADFGHTSPLYTIPIGGTASVALSRSNATLMIVGH